MEDHDRVVAAVLHLRKKLCADPPPVPHKVCVHLCAVSVSDVT